MTVLGEHVQDKELWKEITDKVNAVGEEIKSGKIVVVNAQNGETLNPTDVPHMNIK